MISSWCNVFISIIAAVMIRPTNELCRRCAREMSIDNQTRYIGERVKIALYEETGSYYIDMYDDTVLLKWNGVPNMDLLWKYFWHKDIHPGVAWRVNRPFRNVHKARNGLFLNGIEYVLRYARKEDIGFYTCIINNDQGRIYGTMYLDVINRPTASTESSTAPMSMETKTMIIALCVMVTLSVAMILGVLFVRRRVKNRRRTPDFSNLPPRPLNIGPLSTSSTNSPLFSSEQEYSVVSAPERSTNGAYLVIDSTVSDDTLMSDESIPTPPPRPTTTVPLAGTDNSPDSYYIW
jgi:hypothetical protein